MGIAIAGATASGKTTLSRALAERLGGVILRTDDYYRPLDHLTFEERCLTNFDHPDAIDHGLLGVHLAELLAGRAVEAPCYDFTRHTRFPYTHRVEPAGTVIVEGLFALCEPEVESQCAVRVFVETPEPECLRRRLLRDTTERGRTPEEVVERFVGHVMPMFRLHVEPTREIADVVVSGEADTAHNVERVLAALPSGTMLVR